MKKLFALIIIASGMPLAAQAKECNDPVTKEEVLHAQEKWGDAIVQIGKSEDAKLEAQKVLDNLYAYDTGMVLFKPTLASNKPFRAKEKDALSYFVGGHIEEDKGFALAPYTDVRFDNAGIITDCDTALAMGEYYFTKTDGDAVKVEYSFGYIRDDKDNLKINLHHSSLPFSHSE